MITIGTLMVPKDDEGLPRVSGEVSRVTMDPLGSGFGTHGKKRLVVKLKRGDLLVMKPHRCRTGEVTVELREVYRWRTIAESLSKRLEKARDRKARLARSREARRIKRQERRLFRKEEA